MPNFAASLARKATAEAPVSTMNSIRRPSTRASTLNCPRWSPRSVTVRDDDDDGDILMISGRAGLAGAAGSDEAANRGAVTTVSGDEDDLVAAALEPFELLVGLTRTLSA